MINFSEIINVKKYRKTVEVLQYYAFEKNLITCTHIFTAKSIIYVMFHQSIDNAFLPRKMNSLNIYWCKAKQGLL